jgi:hypothetical protein
MAFLVQSMHDFFGGRKDFVGAVVLGVGVPSVLCFPKLLGNPKLQVGEGGCRCSSLPLRGLPCEAVGTLVARYADVGFDPLRLCQTFFVANNVNVILESHSILGCVMGPTLTLKP